MPSKSKKPEKTKVKKVARDPAHERKLMKANEDPLLRPADPPPEAQVDMPIVKPDAIERAVGPEAAALMKELEAPEPAVLTLPILADSATLFLQGATHLTAQLLGQPECAPLLVDLNGWIKALEALKKLVTGDEDKIEGLKKLVIEQGQPWGERGSKQLTLAGAIVKVKAVNWRPTNDPLDKLTIADLDPAKVESYLRGSAADPEKVLPCYMKATTIWGLKDLTPLQQTNLAKMLADPGEWGQGLRECLKETKYQMMAPTMENEP